MNFQRTEKGFLTFRPKMEDGCLTEKRVVMMVLLETACFYGKYVKALE